MSQIVTVKELCDILKVGRRFIYQCRKLGMPYLKLGNKIVRYDLEEVNKWLIENRRIDNGGSCNVKK